jgi:catechol 2,3-dioxygenase-like lactoylglutathione lyase family enzyme
MPIATGIDHVIIAVQNLDAASDVFAQSLGLHVGGGGTHPQFGTTNRLIVLDDGSYVELLAAQPGEAQRGFIARMLRPDVEGCVGVAMSTADPEQAAATIRARGFQADGPNTGRLVAGEAFSRGWQTVVPHDAGTAGMPFLIKHDTEGEERRRLLAGVEGAAAHALGARGIAGITMVVADLEAAAHAYLQCYDLAPDGEPIEDAMLKARTLPLRLPSGAIVILAAPMRADAGPIAMALQERGEGLFAVTLAVDDLQGAVRALRGRGIGVRVDEPEGVLVAAQLNHRQLHGARLGLVAAQASRPNANSA